jgi:hypothetical protein
MVRLLWAALADGLRFQWRAVKSEKKGAAQEGGRTLDPEGSVNVRGKRRAGRKSGAMGRRSVRRRYAQRRAASRLRGP